MNQATYIGVGNRLKQARTAKGYAIEDVSTALRIRYEYIEALDEGDFGKLPGNAYVNGFLRTYAEFLGFDGEQIIKDYKSEASAWFPNYRFTMPEAPKDSSHPPKILLAICGVLMLVVYFYWYSMNASEMSRVTPIEEPSAVNLRYLAEEFESIDSKVDAAVAIWNDKNQCITANSGVLDQCNSMSLMDNVFQKPQLVAISCNVSLTEMMSYIKYLAIQKASEVKPVENMTPLNQK